MAFVIFEFLDASIGAGIYMGIFVLGMEMVGPSKRPLGGTVLLCFWTPGVIMVGVLSMLTQNFRTLLRIAYAPGVLIFSYLWLLPESPRWLLASGRKREAVNVILNAAQVNKVTFSDETLQRLHNHCNTIENTEKKKEQHEGETLMDVYKSKQLMMRIVSCCFCWCVNAFVSYGLTLNSVDLAGSKYMNFMMINLVEIPAYFVTYFLTINMGRRLPLCGSMLLSGFACLATLFISIDSGFLKLLLFLIGKSAITCSFGILYVYTSEIFPTCIRNSLMSICCMIGRVGSIIAPQTPLLVSCNAFDVYIILINQIIFHLNSRPII